MEILVQDSEADTPAYQPSRDKATIRFTLKNFHNTKTQVFHKKRTTMPDLKSDVFYVKSFPWCISVSRLSWNPDYLNVMLYCEYISTNPWECRGTYTWRALNIPDSAPTCEKFQLENNIAECSSQIFVPLMCVDDVIIELVLKVTHHKCTWANPELEMTLDDIGKLIMKISTNTERMLEQQIEQSDRDRQRTDEIEEKLKLLLSSLDEQQRNKPSTSLLKFKPYALGRGETNAEREHIVELEEKVSQLEEKVVDLEQKVVELEDQVRYLQGCLAETLNADRQSQSDSTKT